MRKTITACDIHARGMRREEHPTGFHTIFLTIDLKSPDTSEEDIRKILELSEEKYCPVWALLKGNVEVNVKYNILSS
jgi:putative redox protein